MDFFKDINLSKFLIDYNKKLTIIVFILLIFIVIFRAPNILLEPRFWAEEGSVYYAHALQSNIIDGIFFSPKNTAGYFLLAASVPTTIAAHFVPVEFAPFVTTYFSLAFVLMIFSLILWGRSYFWGSFLQRAFVCFIVLFFPSSNATGEVWLNTINLQVYCGLFVLVVAFENTSQLDEVKKWFLRVLLGFSILSGVYAVLLSPIYAIKYYYERSKESLIHLSIIFIGAIVQVSVFFYIKHIGLISVKKLMVFSWTKSSLYVLAHQIIYPFFGGESGADFLNMLGLGAALNLGNDQSSQYALLAGFVSLFIIGTLLAFMILKKRGFINIMLVVGFVLLAVLTSLLAIGGAPGGRYAVLPSIIFGLLLLNVATGDEYSIKVRSAVGTALLLSTMIGAYEYQFKINPTYTGDRLPKPQWEEEVKNWRKEPDKYLTMWPYPRWKAPLALPSMVKKLKQQFADVEGIHLESDGDWKSQSINVDGFPSQFLIQFEVDLKNNHQTKLQVLLLGKLNESMRWISIDLNDKSLAINNKIRIDSRQLNKKGKLKMIDVNEIMFRIKSDKKLVIVDVKNLEYRSPYSVLF